MMDFHLLTFSFGETSIMDPDSAREFWKGLQKLATDAPVLVVTDVLDERRCQPSCVRHGILLDGGVGIKGPVD